MFLKALAFAAVLGASPFDLQPVNPEVVLAAQDEATMDKLADGFFGKLKAGQYHQAYSDAFSTPLMKKRVLEIEQVATQTEQAFRTYGPPKDWEHYAEQKPSKNFVRRFYIVRTENTPLFFTVEFYQVDGKWMILNLAYWDSFKSIQ